jgi:hypothetical protein
MENLTATADLKKDLAKYAKTLETLLFMRRLYEFETCLTGGYYDDMMSNLNEQITHVEQCIENIETVLGKEAQLLERGVGVAAELTGRGTGEGYVEMVCIDATEKEDVLTTGETYLVRINGIDKMARIKGLDQKFKPSRFLTADKYKKRFYAYPTPKQAREVFRLAKNEGFSKKEAKATIIRQYPVIVERFDLVEGILNTIYDND